MPLINVNMDNDYTAEVITNGWAYCSISSFNWETKSARFVYSIYASKEAAYSGKKPLKFIEYELTPNGTPAITVSVLISSGVPAVYEYNEESGETIEVSPEIPPVYETSIVREALPSLPELVQNNMQAYGALLQTVDNVALLLPEFNGAQLDTENV